MNDKKDDSEGKFDPHDDTASLLESLFKDTKDSQIKLVRRRMRSKSGVKKGAVSKQKKGEGPASGDTNLERGEGASFFLPYPVLAGSGGRGRVPRGSRLESRSRPDRAHGKGPYSSYGSAKLSGRSSTSFSASTSTRRPVLPFL